MSDYHILDMGRKGDSARVAFHINVPPGETNQASETYRDAIVGYLDSQALASGGLVRFTILPNVDETAHGLDSCAVIESVNTVKFSANLTPSEKRDAIEDEYNAVKAGILQDWQDRLLWWGFAADVP